MDRLPTELLAEIAEWCSGTYNKQSLLAFSASNRHIRAICVPIMFRSISLHEGIENASEQVDALVSSGLVRHVRGLRFGVASFLTKERIQKITREADRRFKDDDWACHPDSPYLSPNGWAGLQYDPYPAMQAPDKYPSYLDPSDAEGILRALFEPAAPRLRHIEVRNVSTLGTPYVRSWDGDPSNKREGTCVARDHVVFATAACEGDLFSALESASRPFSFPRLAGLKLGVFKFMNTMGLICNTASNSNPLVRAAQSLSFDAVHPHPESVDMLDVMTDRYNHNHVMYLLGAMAFSTSPTNGGRRRCLRLGFKNYPSGGASDLVPFPLMNGLTELSLENMLLLEGSLDRTIVASPSLTTLRLRGVRMQYAMNLPSSSSSDEGDRPRVRERHAWGSLLSLCTTVLHGLVNLELYRNGYYRPRCSLSFGGGALSDDYGAMSDVLRTTSRADYQALKKLLDTVKLRRAKLGGSETELCHAPKGMVSVPMQRHST